MRVDAKRRAALAAIAGLLVAPLARAQDPRASEAQAAARAWLAIADKLDAEASYAAAGPRFRTALTPSRWNDAVKLVRFPLGALVQRTVNQTTFTTKLPGQPDSDYALIAYRTSWANKSVGRELVTLERVGGKWQVVGYVIQ
ncbi:MAG: DUF4019 domain-containing protein [Vicinamibacteria bacterium]|jgi:hypothetical protein